MIFDIGANIGRYTQTFAVNSENTIISVETSSNMFNILKETMAPFTNVTTLEYAVYDSKKVPVLFFEWAAEWKDSLKLAIDHLTSLGFTRFHVQNEDKYSYYPLDFELNLDEYKKCLDTSINKVDWGMIWAN